MRKLLLSSVFVTVLFSLGAGNVQAQTCTATPECASLGYTKAKADCPKGALKCPYGNSYFCEEQPCQIGDIYYSDNSCSSDVKSGKTALGVVVSVDATGIHGQVMSAWPVDENGNKSNSDIFMIWGDLGTDIPSLPNYDTPELAVQDFSSCDNTDKIIAFGGSSLPAAWAARSYAPTTETKGKWCLPAAGVMTNIYKNQSAIQVGIRKLGGVEYPNCCMWSSSRSSSDRVFISSLYNDYGLLNALMDASNFLLIKDFGPYVRPVMEF